MLTELRIKHIFGLLKGSLLFILLFFTGCSIKGGYQFVGYNDDMTLFLQDDDAFVEYVSLNDMKDTLGGYYKVISDTLVLTVTNPVIPSYVDKRTRVEEEHLAKFDCNVIKVFVNDEPAEVDVYPNEGRNKVHSDENGTVFLSMDTTLTCFAVVGLGCPPLEYTIMSARSNQFIVYIYDWTTPPVWTRYNFVNKYLIKRRRLYPYSIGAKKLPAGFNYFLRKKIFN